MFKKINIFLIKLVVSLLKAFIGEVNLYLLKNFDVFDIGFVVFRVIRRRKYLSKCNYSDQVRNFIFGLQGR